MNDNNIKTMRDSLINRLYEKMGDDDRIFFLSADMGAPSLDKLRTDFKDRFINVGIAEQNLINISVGLALEGFVVYAYAIAGFLTMRAYEQIRTNLALFSQQKPINVNLIGVGTGVSYDMSGPSHHCLEDISIIRTLPNIIFCSASDWVLAEQFVDFSMNLKVPKYIRLDSKPVPAIYKKNTHFPWDEGFFQLVEGRSFCIVSTGYITNMAVQIANEMKADNFHVGVIDVFKLNPVGEDALFNLLKKYKTVVTLEEGFVNKGGLDSLIGKIFQSKDADIRLKSFGFKNSYVFQSGDRSFLYEKGGLCKKKIVEAVKESGA